MEYPIAIRSTKTGKYLHRDINLTTKVDLLESDFCEPEICNAKWITHPGESFSAYSWLKTLRYVDFVHVDLNDPTHTRQVDNPLAISFGPTVTTYEDPKPPVTHKVEYRTSEASLKIKIATGVVCGNCESGKMQDIYVFGGLVAAICEVCHTVKPLSKLGNLLNITI